MPSLTVRVIKNWNWPDLLRQTPDGKGEWAGIRFTLDEIENCDAVIVLNHVRREAVVNCPPQNIWAIIQEPAVPEYDWLKKGFRQFARVYTPNVRLKGEKYRHSHGALPWHVNKTYDFLKNCPIPEKTRPLSWITSDDAHRAGQAARVSFLAAIKGAVQFDIWGRGFEPIEDKWDGLAPYRYSLAVENDNAPHYWTEKISDCFLGWSMPIYYGCVNIADYFPSEAFIQIDIKQPQESIEIIRAAISGDAWRRNRDAIACARQLVLEKYQFFPFVAQALAETQENGIRARAVLNSLPAPTKAPSVVQQLRKKFTRAFGFFK